MSDPIPILTTVASVFNALSHVILLLCVVIVALLVLLASLLCVVVLIQTLLLRQRSIQREEAASEGGDGGGRRGLTVGFFHPYCNAGGGGERVLWVAIRVMREKYPNARFLVYTGDVDAAPDQIVRKARERFNVDIPSDDRLEFVYLHKRRWVEAERYPVFTLLGQSLGSLYLGFEALSFGAPDIFIDTMGYAFTLPLFKYLGGCKTACYVHYPTISTDMLDKVRVGRAGFNNRAFIANSRLATFGKLMYYRLFAWLYGWAGRRSDVVMVNSSWTEAHIASLWHCHDSVQKIFPPCDVGQFTQIRRGKKASSPSQKRILSVSQFRPEKDHPLQIRALAKFRDRVYAERGLNEEEKEKKWAEVRLLLIGGCRNEEDESRVKDLKDLCRHLAVDDNVEFKVNLSFEDLKKEMGEGLIGLHTMWNEHFGIAVVEMLAAGLVTLAHRSGGPLMDIVIEAPEENRNGFLAVTEDEYAEAIAEILEMSEDTREAVRTRARSSVHRFSEPEFEKGWSRATEAMVNSCYLMR